VRPFEIAGRRIKAIQNARRSQREDAAVGEGRRSARARASLAFIMTGLVLVNPERMPSGGVEANNRLMLFIALLLREEPITDDRHRRPTRADVDMPDLLRRRLAPIGRDSDAGYFAISIGPTQARPITRLRDERRRRWQSLRRRDGPI
jgi:hypothetical protein